jgi:hypothetical protein
MLRRASSAASRLCVRTMMSAAPKTATPPADLARGATADLCDVFITAPVDQITDNATVTIAAPIFRCAAAAARQS